MPLFYVQLFYVQPFNFGDNFGDTILNFGHYFGDTILINPPLSA